MKKSIIVFSHYLKNTNSHYLSYTHNHAKTYVKMGYKVTTLAPYPVLPIINLFKKNKRITVDGVNILIKKRFSLSKYFVNLKINIHGLFYYLSVRKEVKEIVKKENVILFDAHNLRSEGYTAYILKKKYPNITTTVTLHGGDLDQALSHKNGIKLLKKVAKRIDSYVCVSDNYRKKLENIGIKNVVTIFNGIVIHDVKIQKKEKTFVTVANLIERKNIGLLIDAFYEFSKKHNDYNLKIIGEGPLKQQLIEKVSNYNLKNVQFLGQISNKEVYEEFCKAYCFILVSILEGFGIVYPESMYCGCIAVGTKNEGIDGFIQNKKNGFLISPKKEDITKIMEYVVNNDCSHIIEQGIKDAKKLTWEENVKKYLSIK